MFSPGEPIDNFTLVAFLGKNAFGPVWSARESITNRLVRIYFLSSDDDFEIHRFTRSISLLSRLNHPAIIAHTGHGYINYRPYLATEHVQGPTLSTLMTNGGRMDELRVLQIASQIAEGLDHGWRTAEIVLRNLSPETILVDLASLQDEDLGVQIKITDFGHVLGRRLVDRYDADAVTAEAEFQRITQSEKVGNLSTMAPEQIRGTKLTPAADMYALGIIMYHLLTGKTPFNGTDDEVRNAHLRAVPLDLAPLVPGLQSGTAVLIRRLLAKTPDGRFPDWTSCLAKLHSLRRQLEQRRRPRPPIDPTPEGGNRRRTDGTERVPPPLHPPRGDSADESPRRRTETFSRTPQGHVLRGGVQGGGAPPLPNELEPPPVVRRWTETLERTPTGMPLLGGVPPLPPPPSPTPLTMSGGGPSPWGASLPVGTAENQHLFALLAERLRQDLTTQPGPAATATAAPHVDDGLSADQRAAVWAYLFRNPAIQEASVSVAKAVMASAVTPTSAEELLDPKAPAASAAPLPTPVSVPSPAPATDEDPIAPELTEEERPMFAQLFDELEDGKTGTNEALTALSDNEPHQEVAHNPTLSPWWKPVLEILRVTVVGRVRHKDAPATLTQRFTAGLRRLVASRETALAEVAQLTDAGKLDEAEKRLDQVATSKGAAGNDDLMCLLRARIWVLRGDSVHSLHWAQMAVRQNSANPYALATVGYLHLQSRRIRAAIVIFDEATNSHPNSALGPLGQAALLFLAGLDTKAGEALDEAARREHHPAILRLAALQCRAREDTVGEATFLRQLLTGTAADWEINERLQALANPGEGNVE